MTRGKRLFLLLLALLVLAGAVFALWYPRPRTAEQLLPGFQWSKITQSEVDYTYDEPRNGIPGSLSVRELSGQTPAFAAGQAEFDALLTLLQELRFSPKLSALLPFRRSGSVRVEGGDQSTDILCHLTTEQPVVLSLFIGPRELSVRYGADSYSCSLKEQEETLAALADFFLTHSTSSGAA